MKRQGVRMAVLLVTMGSLCAVGHAQAGGVSAKIPFKFSVAGKTFAAGDYRMDVSSQQVTVVSLSDGETVAMALANKVSGKGAGRTGRIVFRCYRERCFLGEVWSPSADEGRQVMATGAEREAARQGEERYFAVMGRE